MNTKHLTLKMIDLMKEYMRENHLDRPSFAYKMNVTISAVDRWLSDECLTMPHELWERFEELSNGNVHQMTVSFSSQGSGSSTGEHTCLNCLHRSVCLRVHVLAQYFTGVDVTFECENYKKGES